MKKLLLNACLSMLAGLVIVGCGGGGDEVTPSGSTSDTENITITAENTNAIVSAVVGSIGSGLDGLEESQNMSGDISQPILKILDQPSFKAVLENQKMILAETIGPVECTDGGIMSITVNEAQTSMTFTYSDCSMAGIYMDGIVDLDFNADQNSMVMLMLDFTLKEGTFTSFTTYTEVNVSATANGDFVSATFYNESGYSIEDGDRTDVKEFTMTFKSGATSGEFIFTVDGWIKNDCFGDWVKVTTNTDMKIMETAECPHAGSMSIEGSNSYINIVFNSNGAEVSTFQTVDGQTEGILNVEMSCSEMKATTCSN